MAKREAGPPGLLAAFGEEPLWTVPRPSLLRLLKQSLPNGVVAQWLGFKTGGTKGSQLRLEMGRTYSCQRH